MPGFFLISNKCYVCQHGFYFLNDESHSTNSGGEVNLASYYIRILLGLYYKQLPSVLAASTKGSLREYIRFEWGFEKLYDKTSVRIAESSVKAYP
jgi:hypothetical protein